MPAIHKSVLPPESLLGRYAGTGAYTDAYRVAVADAVPFSKYVEAFYTSRVFKLERRLITILGMPANDADARALAAGERSRFSAWRVEARNADQLLMAAGRTRSWFMVAPGDTEGGTSSTALYFGSAVIPHARGGMGLSFKPLLGFHKRYSSVLLASAVHRLGDIAG